jgi:putative membrane protein
MDSTIRENPWANLRDYLAEERTFLAWIRTGIALMGFGFLLARFEIFIDQLHLAQNTPRIPHGLSLWFGASLIALGVATNLISAWRYIRPVSERHRDQFTHRSICAPGIVVALFLALLGSAMTSHVVLVLARSLSTLHA